MCVYVYICIYMCVHGCIGFHAITIRHKKFIIIKFDGFPMNHLDKKLTNFNFIELQFYA